MTLIGRSRGCSFDIIVVDHKADSQKKSMWES